MSESPTAVETLPQWHQKQVAAFIVLRKDLVPASKELEAVLTAIAAEIAPDAKVHVRVKGELSTSEKFLRGDNPTRHPTPLDIQTGLTDLIGGQIVAYTSRDVDALCARIEKMGAAHRDGKPFKGNLNEDGSLEVDESNSIDTATRLAPTEFGYTARHYIVRLHGEQLLGVNVAKASKLGRKMEVQICHVLTHAWTVVTHDRVYKTDLTTPTELKRRVAEAKAMLDTTARQVEQAVVELDRYRRKHAGRLRASVPKEKKEDELNEFDKAKLTCDSVVSQAPEDSPSSAHIDAMEYRADLAIAEQDWEYAATLLDRVVICRPQVRVRLAAVLRHLKARGTGAAITMLNDALDVDPTDGEAACALADLVLSKRSPTATDFIEAESKLSTAFNANPCQPNLLMQYITARLLRDGDASQLSLSRGGLVDAIAECRKRCDLGSDVPVCLLQHARLALFADDVFDAVNTYCLASLHQAGIDQLKHEQHLLKMLLDRTKASKSEPSVKALRVGIECAVELLNLLIARHEESTISAANPEALLFLRKGPIVILAGGCDKTYETHVHRYESTISKAFKRFRGTIISGGTKSGISRLAAEIADRSEDTNTSKRRITAIGYLPPAKLVEQHEDQIDDRYDRIFCVTPKETGEPLYSPLGPIHTWRDLLATGRDPNEVRVVGINGGKVSGFEFRLALALGAVVGLIEDSGRAVATLLTDAHWKVQSGLARLLCDAETIELFVNFHAAPITDQTPLDGDTIDILGQTFHANYRNSKMNSREYVDDSMREWKDLAKVFQDSNLHQVRSMQWILSTEGFAIVSISDVRDAIDLGVDEPQPDGKKVRVPNSAYVGRVLPLARLEHARWNAERLSLGWTQGPDRSLARKTSPFLVPFDAVPALTQKYDLDPYLNLAKLLESHDLKVVDMRAPLPVPKTKAGRGKKAKPPQ
ncbi:MAG: RyR domain-containing protein [Phycisphaeraceae bacterium]